MAHRPQVIVVTGMSGAGRSTAADVLEDLGYFVIDNLPPTLISEVVRMNDLAESPRRLAVVVDSRGGFPLGELNEAILDLMGQGVECLVLFLDADRDVLIRRYEENRRPHPLGLGTLADSIAAERELLAELRAAADVVVDTTDMNVHQLRERIEHQFQEDRPERPMRVAVRSFGFKHGTPRDADLVFDVRFLPNPHWQAGLRELTGRDQEVREFVLEHADAKAFMDQVEGLLSFLIPRFRMEGKSYLSVAVGCTGGHHRSVAIAEELGAWLESQGIQATVQHRDLDR
jgi:UPF0042 nucleotide-binding protein